MYAAHLYIMRALAPTGDDRSHSPRDEDLGPLSCADIGCGGSADRKFGTRYHKGADSGSYEPNVMPRMGCLRWGEEYRLA